MEQWIILYRASHSLEAYALNDGGAGADDGIEK